VAVDPEARVLYLTEDHPAGRFYRFIPDAYPDLSSGRLEAMVVGTDGAISWVAVADPSATSAPVRDQVPGATVFPGNEGVWFHDGTVVFTSKHDHRVHAIDTADQTYRLLWDGVAVPEPLRGVDNVTIEAGSGDVFVAEDGGNMELVLITPEGEAVPFARVVEPGHEGSEVTGPVFSPDGTRLYFSSQRGPTPGTLTDIAGDRGLVGDTRNGGVTWEVTGPFRGARPATTSTSTTTVPSPATTLAQAAAGDGAGDGDDSGLVPVVGVAAALGVAGAGAAWWLRSRRPGDQVTD
jgi:secreted PhoX family phosphatase